MPGLQNPVKQVRFNNIAQRVGNLQQHDWFEWRVFVDEDSETLDRIESVEYLLHHSFPNPLRRSDDRSTKFAIESAGWGEFRILITVFFKDGSRLETTYDLDLSKASAGPARV